MRDFTNNLHHIVHFFCFSTPPPLPKGLLHIGTRGSIVHIVQTYTYIICAYMCTHTYINICMYTHAHINSIQYTFYRTQYNAIYLSINSRGAADCPGPKHTQGLSSAPSSAGCADIPRRASTQDNPPLRETQRLSTFAIEFTNIWHERVSCKHRLSQP